jgi:hypothetical protein
MSICLDEGDSKHVQGQRNGGKTCKVECRRGSDVSEEDDERRIVLDEQVKGDCVRAVVLPIGVEGVKIAWQQ